MTTLLHEPAAKTAPYSVEVSVVMPCLNEARTVGHLRGQGRRGP